MHNAALFLPPPSLCPTLPQSFLSPILSRLYSSRSSCEEDDNRHRKLKGHNDAPPPTHKYCLLLLLLSLHISLRSTVSSHLANVAA